MSAPDFTPKINSKYNRAYRYGLTASLVIGLPLKYINAHRRGLPDASRVMKVHHGKEVLMRLVIGFVLSQASCFYLFGPKSSDRPMYLWATLMGQTPTIDPKSAEANEPIDESSLKYSTSLKASSNAKKYVPGRIRD